MHKMPKEIEFVADKILDNKPIYDEIKNMLKSAIGKLNNDSLSHSSFCDALRTPNGIAKKLLAIYGVSDRQLLHAFEQIGFHPQHRMYSSLYYQTLMIVYYVGSRADDDLLRTLAVALIYVKIFNGRQYRYMPNGCQSDIAHYLIQSVFRTSHTFKKYPSPFNAITQSLAPVLDQKYNPYVQKDPAHPVKGLAIILSASWNRMDQIFYKSVQSHYYKAHADGKKSIIGQASDGVGGKEVDNISQSKIVKSVEKVQRNMVHGIKLNDEDHKFLKKAYSVSDLFLEHSDEFLNNEKNEDELKNVYELIFEIASISDTNICSLNVVGTVGKITSAKGNNVQVTKLKSYIDKLLKVMYKKLMVSISNSNKLKLRKVLILIIVLRAKKASCSKAGFENF